eukprot:Clim_evm15s204 gene=Clim_evmTU15s204
MGNAQTRLSEEQLEEYQECTFFTRREIMRIFKRFNTMNPENKPYLTPSEVMNIPELRNNPFRSRICQVFSEDGTGKMTFDDFLDMLSVFSENATRDVKASYAFKIYDFDGDNYLDKNDLMSTLYCLCGQELTEEQMDTVADKMLEESDLDGDNRMSYVEFEHVISRAPDFVNTFRIRI